MHNRVAHWRWFEMPENSVRFFLSTFFGKFQPPSNESTRRNWIPSEMNSKTHGTSTVNWLMNEADATFGHRVHGPTTARHHFFPRRNVFSGRRAIQWLYFIVANFTEFQFRHHASTPKMFITINTLHPGHWSTPISIMIAMHECEPLARTPSVWLHCLSTVQWLWPHQYVNSNVSLSQRIVRSARDHQHKRTFEYENEPLTWAWATLQSKQSLKVYFRSFKCLCCRNRLFKAILTFPYHFQFNHLRPRSSIRFPSCEQSVTASPRRIEQCAKQEEKYQKSLILFNDSILFHYQNIIPFNWHALTSQLQREPKSSLVFIVCISHNSLNQRPTDPTVCSPNSNIRTITTIALTTAKRYNRFSILIVDVVYLNAYFSIYEFIQFV